MLGMPRGVDLHATLLWVDRSIGLCWIVRLCGC